MISFSYLQKCYLPTKVLFVYGPTLQVQGRRSVLICSFIGLLPLLSISCIYILDTAWKARLKPEAKGGVVGMKQHLRGQLSESTCGAMGNA